MSYGTIYILVCFLVYPILVSALVCKAGNARINVDFKFITGVGWLFAPIVLCIIIAVAGIYGLGSIVALLVTVGERVYNKGAK